MPKKKADKPKDPKAVAIGKNLATMRGTMTQRGLAEAMQDKGYNWVSATVWAAESGDRSIKLDEAQALTEILNKPFEFFFVDSDWIENLEQLIGHKNDVERSHKELVYSLAHFLTARLVLKAHIPIILNKKRKSADASKFEKPLKDADDVLNKKTFKQAVLDSYQMLKANSEDLTHNELLTDFENLYGLSEETFHAEDQQG